MPGTRSAPAAGRRLSRGRVLGQPARAPGDARRSGRSRHRGDRLDGIATGRAPDERRAGLAAAYRAELAAAIVEAGDVPAGSRMPDARARPTCRRGSGRPTVVARRQAERGAGGRSAAVRNDLAGLPARPPDHAAGDPRAAAAARPARAGKSALTRVLAARLPAADFLVVRVVLREVPAEATVQDQIEQAVRAAIGETVAWPDLARSAGDALPVMLLDGFDELLQATGVHQSDYLERVAAFQQREAVHGRPVAVLVTSRIAVADRARIPAGHRRRAPGAVSTGPGGRLAGHLEPGQRRDRPGHSRR